MTLYIPPLSAVRRLCATLLSLPLVFLVVPAYADEIDEVVVTASRIDAPLWALPFAASIVTGDELTLARPQQGLDEALQGVPGLLLQNRYNYAQDLRISLRGFGARSAFGIRGVRVVVDGIPETLPDGQSGVDGIDLGAVTRLEVLRGGAGALYGNAGGGVLLVETEAPEDAAPVFVRAVNGADGFRQAQVKTALATESGGVLLSLSDLDYTGFREHSAARNRQASLRATWTRGASDWNVTAHHTDQPEAFDPGGINAAQAEAAPGSARTANVNFNAGEALTQTRVGVRYRYRHAELGELALRGYAVDRDFEGRLPFQNGGWIEIDRAFGGFGVQWQRAFATAGVAWTLYVGGEQDQQRDDRTRFDNLLGTRGAMTLDQRERVTATGGYALMRTRLGERGLLHLGVRYDEIDYDVDDRFLANGDDSGVRTFTEWSPAIGASWQWLPSLQVYANLSRSFEAPTTTELANPSTAGGFNAALEAQLADHRELGLRFRRAGQQLDAALYAIDLDDELIPFELAAFPGRDFFANAGASSRRGIEATWRADWNDQWRTTLSYTWSDFTLDDFTRDGEVFDGNEVPGTAEHVAFASVDYQATGGWFLGAEFTYVSTIIANNANTVRAGPARLLTLRASYPLSVGDWQLSPFVTVSNTLDERYTANVRTNAFGGRFFEPGPDRAIVFGITARFGQPSP
ncbi:MAG: TonB-dependent receptor [Pseudomonadota bacterium]